MDSSGHSTGSASGGNHPTFTLTALRAEKLRRSEKIQMSCGHGWTRTIDIHLNRAILLLGEKTSLAKNVNTSCAWMGSNHRLPPYKGGTLTAELQARNVFSLYCSLVF